MIKFYAWLSSAYDHLNAVSPVLPWALLTVGVFLAIYCARRFAPRQWLWLEGKLGDNRIAQALPAALVGSLVSAAATGGDVGQSWKGALAGCVAPLLHHALKSYDGADAVLDAAQAKLLKQKSDQTVADAAKAAAIANAPALLALAEKATQQIPAAAPVANDIVVPPPPALPSIPVTVEDPKP